METRIPTATRSDNLIKEKEMVEEKISSDAKRAMWSQFLGFGMDAYDMAMVIVLAPVLAKTFASPKLSEAWQFLMVALLYAVTMAARPVGAAIFGHYSDKIGRRFLLILTIAGVGVMSVVCAFIPTPAQVGLVTAYIIFMIVRFIMGCFFGGEYAVGHTFAIEHAPQRLRGTIGGFIQSGFPLGYAIASFIVLGVSLIIGEAAMHEWGWRLMFFSGVAPVGLALYIRKSLVESPVFEHAKKTGTVDEMPLMTLFKPPTLWIFLQVFAFMTGLFLVDYAVYQFIPKILKGPDKFNLIQYTFIYGVALFCAFLGYNFYGWLSDKLGRRKLTLWYCLYCIVLGIPLYKTLIWASVTRSMAIAIVAAILAASLKLAWGIIPAYLSERFPTNTRSVGVGLGYSAGALVGGAGITPLVALVHEIPPVVAVEGPNELWLSASAVLTLGAIITFVSLLWSPETKDLKLSEVVEHKREETEDLVVKGWEAKAVAFYKRVGKAIALAEFSNPQGAFVQGEKYIFVLSLKGTMLAHGVNEKYIGRDFIDVKDSEGKSFIREIIEATKTKGSGLIEYKWFNPVTKEDQIKHVNFEKVDDVIICGGVYGEVWEDFFVQTVLYYE